jgi:hypothetical protein
VPPTQRKRGQRLRWEALPLIQLHAVGTALSSANADSRP